MYEFDKRLRALAGCPVIEEKGGGMVFNPNPVIAAQNDGILAHEICHVLAGRQDYDIFSTAVVVRNDDLFKYILNMLYDWYHEYLQGRYSGFLWSKLGELHEAYKYKPTGLDTIDSINRAYCSRHTAPEVFSVRDSIDLVVLADRMRELVIGEATALGLAMTDLAKLLGLKQVVSILGKKGKLGGPKADIGIIPKKSDYYIRAVARHFLMIEELSNLWKKNKYEWVNHYYGEINWKDLPGMLLGNEINLPVWRLFSKIGISRKVFLVIDRSGSTSGICDLIMDTAVIISESLRMLNVPISILDVGVTNNVVNGIDDDLDLSWFTPMHVDGTPLGEVCSMITKANHDSYLLIITDGEPNDWDTLVSALGAFPGSHLTFVIGDSYGRYVQKVRNAIHVEPHTIIREMLYESTLD